MKKALVSILTFLLSTIMLFSCVIGLTACSNNNTNENPPVTDNNTNENPPVTNFSVDLTGYVANVGNATALGIMKLDSNNGSQVDDNRVSPMSVKLFTEDIEEKNYIVKSSNQYNANNPELSESGIEKISFTKTITENVTTITRGTKYILAKENMDKQNCSINFASVKDFTYSIYLNDTCLLDNVVDNDNNDINKEIGVIEIDGLKKDKEYAVKYSGVGEETTITQDEIEGEIDKLYVLNDYTFISFVPKGESKRPANDILIYDTDGIATYDKCDYFSNGVDRQSFVIDNTTGLVYDLKNIVINKLQNGLILANNDGFVYDMKVQNQNLYFFTLFTNTQIKVKEYFKDAYGNNFIKNETINEIDSETNTLFYTKGYYRSKQNVVICIKGSAVEQSSWCRDDEISKIKKIGRNATELEINEEDVFNFDVVYMPNYTYFECPYQIINKHLFTYTNPGRSYVYRNYDIEQKNSQYYQVSCCDYILDNNVIIAHGSNYTTMNDNVVYAIVVDFNDESQWNTGYDGTKEYIANQLTPVLENCKISRTPIALDKNFVVLYESNYISGTSTYCLTIDYKDNKKIVKPILISEYQAENKKEIILQPLNK